MKVFMDTNVLIDFITRREGVEEARKILQMGENGTIELCASVLSMINTAYIAHKGRTKEKLYEELFALSRIIRVLPMDEGQWLQALHQQARDLEDALQYQCAVSAGCDCIVTRNTRDFGFAQVALYTPQQLLAVAAGGVV